MARAPRTDHARARAALVAGKISKEEYALCWSGLAWVTKSMIWLPDDEPDGAFFGWVSRPLSGPSKDA